MIDLRSDTVTRPSEAMKAAMFAAELGDDVFGDDPTVIALQDHAAAIFGMEAALFCPSGTMTNQIAIKVNSSAPGEIICDKLSHVHKYEGGGIGFNAGLVPELLSGPGGILDAGMVKAVIKPDDPHFPESQLVSLENTCNKGGGSIYPLANMQEIRNVCDQHGMKLHLDGARIFNAIVESEYDPLDLGKIFHTISVCLSKGLGAPVGSVLLGDRKSIHKALRIRKLFGGGMRQSGMLAAAGIFALNHNIERLKDDHKRARILGEEITKMEFVESVMTVHTNILVFQLKSEIEQNRFILHLAQQGIAAAPFGPGQIRFVTHLDFGDDQLDQCITKLRKIRISELI